jgi:hypothetical protein
MRGEALTDDVILGDRECRSASPSTLAGESRLLVAFGGLGSREVFKLPPDEIGEVPPVVGSPE